MSLIWTHKFAINSTTEVTHDSLKSMLTTNTRFEHLQQTYVLSRDISLIFVFWDSVNDIDCILTSIE